MRAFEIPLAGRPVRFAITLNGTTYTLCVQFRNAGPFTGELGDWILDIGDNLGQPLVCGIPLLPGHNLLAQYDYLNFTGELWVWSDGDRDAAPTYLGLGTSSHLLFVTRP